jgi:hypothetical protein
MEIRWLGHGGGAGLATGLTIGGLVAAPRYYDGPYPTTAAFTRRDMSADRLWRTGWEAIACRAIARSIRWAAPIGAAMADGTIAGSSPLPWRVPAEMKCGSRHYGIPGVEGRSPR